MRLGRKPENVSRRKERGREMRRRRRMCEPSGDFLARPIYISLAPQAHIVRDMKVD